MKLNRTKIGSAVVAVVVAMTVLVMAGCGYGAAGVPETPPVTTPPAAWETIFELATDEVFQAMEHGTVTADALFTGIMLTGAAGTAPFHVVAGPGDQNNSIRLVTNDNWGQGIDLRYADFEFEAGDTILLVGYIENFAGGSPPRLQVNLTPGVENAIYGANALGTGAFSIEHTLTPANISAITGNTEHANIMGLRIEFRTGSGAAVRFDNIRVQRPTDAPDETDPDVTVREEVIINFAPGQFVGAARRGGDVVTTLVRQGTEFIELQIAGRSGNDHGLEIFLRPGAGVPEGQDLLSAGVLSPTGIYTITVEGRADDTADGEFVHDGNPVNPVFHIRGSPGQWAVAASAPMVEGEAFGPITGTFNMADSFHIARLMTNDGVTTANIILTRVVIARQGDGSVVWSLADTLVPQGAPDANVLRILEANGRNTILRGTLESLEFSALAGMFAPEVFWSVTPAGTMTGRVLTVPYTATAETVTVIARSRHRPDIYATKTIAVESIGITRTAPTAARVTVAPNATQQYTVAVTPARAVSALTWDVASGGGDLGASSINADGLLTVGADATGLLVVSAIVDYLTVEIGRVVVEGTSVVIAGDDAFSVRRGGSAVSIPIEAINVTTVSQTVNFSSTNITNVPAGVTIGGSIVLDAEGMGTGNLTLTATDTAQLAEPVAIGVNLGGFVSPALFDLDIYGVRWSLADVAPDTAGAFAAGDGLALQNAQAAWIASGDAVALEVSERTNRDAGLLLVNDAIAGIAAGDTIAVSVRRGEAAGWDALHITGQNTGWPGLWEIANFGSGNAFNQTRTFEASDLATLGAHIRIHNNEGTPDMIFYSIVIERPASVTP